MTVSPSCARPREIQRIDDAASTILAGEPASGCAVTALQAAAPPGLLSLTPDHLVDLQRATARLVTQHKSAARAELIRFRQVRDRTLQVDHDALRAAHAGRTVLVTGGTGCVGSALLAEIVALEPRQIISISRGLECRWPRFDGVEYLHVDVRDAQALQDLFGRRRPDIVYHLAAQHDPGLAEREAARTLSTNITGTVNVVDACRNSPGVRLACASTGKALRPFTTDVYAGSKKATEWILGRAVADGELTATAVRFTHIVDNSIILGRLNDWARQGAPVRLHSSESMFYLQSAREAAQLLLSSTLDTPTGTLGVGAIRDLGWPISLLDLAVGVIDGQQSVSPLYVCGFEAGYEKSPYPGMYDPMVSGATSPLFNAFEAHDIAESDACGEVDVLRFAPVAEPGIGRLITAIGVRAAGGAQSAELCALLADCGWRMLQEALRLLPNRTLARHATLLRNRLSETFSENDCTIRTMVLREESNRDDHRLSTE